MSVSGMRVFQPTENIYRLLTTMPFTDYTIVRAVRGNNGFMPSMKSIFTRGTTFINFICLLLLINLAAPYINENGDDIYIQWN